MTKAPALEPTPSLAVMMISAASQHRGASHLVEQGKAVDRRRRAIQRAYRRGKAHGDELTIALAGSSEARAGDGLAVHRSGARLEDVVAFQQANGNSCPLRCALVIPCVLVGYGLCERRSSGSAINAHIGSFLTIGAANCRLHICSHKVNKNGCQAGIIRRRGQVAALAAAGAPASLYSSASRRSDPPAPRPASFFFCVHFPDPDPVISISWRWSEAGPLDVRSCYRATGSVTFPVAAKSLFRHGFKGLLPCYRDFGTLYTYAGARACTSTYLSLLGNMVTNEYCISISTVCLLLAPLPRDAFDGSTVTSAAPRIRASRAAIKIVGGYRLFAADLLDLQAPSEGARRNFRAIGTRATGSSSAATSSYGNGGNLPMSGAGSGAVGTMALEWSAHRLEIARLSGPRHLLGQQTRHAAIVAQGAAGAADRGDPPAPPPFARARSLGRRRSMLTGFGSPFGHDWSARVERALNSFGGTGWGVRAIKPPLEVLQSLEERFGAAARRVGNGEPSSERLAPEIGEASMLWGGPSHVNA